MIKFENAQAFLYLEVLKGNCDNEMLYTMEDKETWTIGGEDRGEDPGELDPEKEKNHIILEGQCGIHSSSILANIASITYEKGIGWYFKQEADGKKDECRIGAQFILKSVQKKATDLDQDELDLKIQKNHAYYLEKDMVFQIGFIQY